METPMRNVGRKLAFVLASSNHGTMIVNRLDHRATGPTGDAGVGNQLLEKASVDSLAVELGAHLLLQRRRIHGDGAVAIDCGADIGAHTIEWAIAMTGWGSVIAVEAQERIYYALAGNIAINNCFNAIAMHAAVSSEPGIAEIPVPDEFIGHAVDVADDKLVPIQKITLDSLELPRVDLIKIDTEGMEMQALEGARETLERCRPILLIESIKAGRELLRAWLKERGYQVIDAGIHILALHKTDAVLTQLAPQDVQPEQSTAAA
jgi:FkbM family methyltransferase